MVETLVQQFRAEIDGTVSDKSRVVDHLLDIRSAATNRPSVVAEADRLLADVPGLTTVENTWWVAALDSIEAAMTAVPVTP